MPPVSDPDAAASPGVGDDLDDGSRPPGPPGAPEVTDFDAEEATVRWTPPEEEAEAELTGYFVEYLLVSSSGKGEQDAWEEYPQRVKPAKRPSVKVTGLDEGNKYQFRVR